jgi:hypothetical protein
VLAAIGAFIIAGLSWLGVNPIQPGPVVHVQVTVLQSPGEIVTQPTIGVALSPRRMRAGLTLALGPHSKHKLDSANVR